MKPKELAAFIGLSISWGAAFYWTKVALVEVGPITLVALRLLIGAIGLGLYTWFRRPNWSLSRREWIWLLIVAVTNEAIPFVATTWGQLWIDSGVASILLSTSPLFTLLAAHFLLDDDKVTWMRTFALFVGFVGVVILLRRDIGADQNSILGYLAYLVGSIFYGLSAVWTRKHLSKVPLLIQALVPIALADAMVWAIVPYVEAPITLPQTVPVWWALFWSGLLSSCLAYIFYYYLLHSIGPTRTSMVTYTFPVVGIALGVGLLHEPLDAWLILGTLLILGSVVVVNRQA